MCVKPKQKILLLCHALHSDQHRKHGRSVSGAADLLTFEDVVLMREQFEVLQVRGVWKFQWLTYIKLPPNL